MTNREKYAEEIIDMALRGICIAVDKGGKLCNCKKNQCSDCIASNPAISCREKIKEWSEKEYAEPAFDWSKVPVDTKILVRDSEDKQWKRRYFARYKNHTIYAWCAGSTSYSADGCNDVSGWEHAKLAEDDV